MGKKLLPFILIINLALLQSCTHKSEIAPEVIPVITGPEKEPEIINPIDSICFSESIEPILVSNCTSAGCHDDFFHAGGINLTSYLNTVGTVSGNLLIQAIMDKGALGMPPAPQKRLNAEQISLIQSWVKEGMKDGIDCQGPCDTTNITFGQTIFPLLQNNCIGCHSTTAPVFTNYSDIKSLADNGMLLCVIKHLNGCVPMPDQLPKLSDCKIKLISKWVESGAPNN